MTPLTEDIWRERFAELRPHILDEWPEVPRQDLFAIGGDYAGLVALIHRRADESATTVVNRLRNIDVDRLDLGGDEDAPGARGGRATVDQLRLGTGFSDTERDRILNRLRKLDRRLRRFPADAVDLELSVKERDATTQKVTLECRLPGYPSFVATSSEMDLRAALVDVREDLWRQMDDAITNRSGR
jgi:ribosome-associated translation inhibitor RaiA